MEKGFCLSNSVSLFSREKLARRNHLVGENCQFLELAGKAIGGQDGFPKTKPCKIDDVENKLFDIAKGKYCDEYFGITKKNELNLIYLVTARWIEDSMGEALTQSFISLNTRNKVNLSYFV